MILQTPFLVDVDLIDHAMHRYSGVEIFILNEPTGNFFYDNWTLKPELLGTPWEEIYNSLSVENKGEARVIKLVGNESYFSHADIDDRYHLNLSGSKSFLIDLDNLKMYPIFKDGVWYDMDAGIVHTAANFSNRPRYQLVVRKLLSRGNLKDPKDFKITAVEGVDNDDARFIFDDVLSKWLNRKNKEGRINNFMFSNGIVTFSLERSLTPELMKILPKEFKVE